MQKEAHNRISASRHESNMPPGQVESVESKPVASCSQAVHTSSS